jgi:nicotinamide-nucleotide amidase
MTPHDGLNMVSDAQLSELASRVAQWALRDKRRIVTAESCTGGWIAKVFTDLPGSSRWFECGYVTYSNAAKLRDLGVAQRTLDAFGAVSEQTVREMAAGVIRVSGADVSIAVSGIAGPDGGSVEKPVGSVWFCVGRRHPGAGDSDRSRAGSGMSRAASAGSDASPHGGARLSPASAPSEVELASERKVFPGDRETVRRAAVQRALELVLGFGCR